MFGNNCSLKSWELFAQNQWNLCLINVVLFSYVYTWTNLKVKADNIGEYSCHRFIIEFCNGDNIKMSNKSWRDRVASSSRWAQGAYKLKINKIDFWCIFFVIPINRKSDLRFLAVYCNVYETKKTKLQKSIFHITLYLYLS